jgi:glycosyltransferase involved in cell wall biosynthesis
MLAHRGSLGGADMNVLFLATLPPTSSTLVGRTLPLARALLARNHRASVVTLGGPAAGPALDIPVSLVGPSLRQDERGRPARWTMLSRLLRGTRALRAALRASRPDVLILEKPHPQNVFASSAYSGIMLLDADDDERFASRLSSPERIFMGRVEAAAARRASAVTVCSPYLEERYRTELGATRVALIPTGITPSSAPAPDLRKMLGLSPSATIMLYLGSLALSSGHRVDNLLGIWDAFAEQSVDAHLVLAGDGIDADALRHNALALRHHGRVHFLGRFAAEEAEGLARQATVLVDPVDDSRAAKAKSSSRALLALRTGVPLVAGDVGIHRTFLPAAVRETALYPAGDSKKLLTALSHAVTPGAREAFRQNTHGSWEQWSWERLGKLFVDFVEDIAQ